MSEHSKIFTYEIEGLSYTVTVYEEGGEYFADITVNEGAMDVNAVYFGDSDYSGSSDMLGGPLNMNGATQQAGVQWDEAVALSKPGLGPDGADKETYLTSGDTLTISLDIDSLDEIDVFGIRATSTSTAEGSIKGISEEPEEPEDPEDPLYEKVFFGEQFSESGAPLGGTFILSEEPDPNTYNNLALPDGTEPTFENYLDYFLSDEVGGDLSTIQSVVFYEFDQDGNPEELFRIDAPEGGFQDADELLAAYDDVVFGDEDPLLTSQLLGDGKGEAEDLVEDFTQDFDGQERFSDLGWFNDAEAGSEETGEVEEDEYEFAV